MPVCEVRAGETYVCISRLRVVALRVFVCVRRQRRAECASQCAGKRQKQCVRSTNVSEALSLSHYRSRSRFPNRFASLNEAKLSRQQRLMLAVHFSSLLTTGEKLLPLLLSCV